MSRVSSIVKLCQLTVVGFLFLASTEAADAAFESTRKYLKDKVKSYVARQLTNATGHEVTIAGEININWGLAPTVALHDVRVKNAAWGSAPHLLEIGTVEVEVVLKDLLWRQLTIPRLRLARLRALLEVSPDGEYNWGLSEPREEESSSDSRLPVIEKISVERGRVRFRDERHDIFLEAKMNTTSPNGGVEVEVAGKVRSNAVDLRALGGPLHAFFSDTEGPYPLNLAAHAAGSHLEAQGNIEEARRLHGVDVEIVIGGSAGELISAITEREVRTGPDYEIEGELRGGYEGGWTLDDFRAGIGDSSMRGRLELVLGGDRPRLTGDLHAPRLAVERLMSLAGDGEDRESNPEGLMSTDWLTAADLQVGVTADQVSLPRATLSDVDVQLGLEDGELALEPLQFRVAGGVVRAPLMLQVNNQELRGRLELHADGLGLGELTQGGEDPGTIAGQVAIELKAAQAPITARSLVSSVQIEELQVRYTQGEDTELRANATTRQVSSGAGSSSQALDLEVAGRYLGQPVEASLTRLRLLDLMNGEAGFFPFSARVGLPETQATAEGMLRYADRTLTIRDFQLGTTESEVAGEVVLGLADEQPSLTADLTAKRLELGPLTRNLAAFAGTKDKDGEASPEESPGRSPIPEVLTEMEAVVDLHVQEMATPHYELVDFKLQARLSEGTVQLKPVRFGLNGGRVNLRAEARLDEWPLPGRLDGDFERIDLDGVVGPFQSDGKSREPLGIVEGNLRLHATVADFSGRRRDMHLPFLGRLVIEESRIRYVNDARKVRVAAFIDTRSFDASSDGLYIEARGRYRGEPFELEWHGDPILDLRDEQEPYSVKLRINAADSKAMVAGKLIQPLKLKGLDLRVEMSGPNPARLAPITGLALPDLPPYRIEGELSRNGAIWQMEEMAGVVGDSDLRGILSLNTARERLLLEADLTSKKVDFDDLAGLIGKAPDTGPGETASPAQRREDRTEERRAFVLPNDPIDLTRVRRMDARVSFRGKRVEAPRLPMDDVRIEYALENGVMTFSPLEFGTADGTVRIQAEIDASGRPLDGDFEAQIARVHLGKFLNSEVADASAGIISGRARYWVRGNSIADFFASADGGLFLLMTGGQLDSLMVELAGLDLGETILVLLSDDAKTPLDCTFADLHTENGIMNVETFVADTRDTLFVVKGSVNLAEETLDLVLEPHPKDFSLFSFNSPIHIEGRFKNPSVYPDAEDLSTQGLTALLAGPLALTSLTALDHGQEAAHCEGLVESIKDAM